MVARCAYKLVVRMAYLTPGARGARIRYDILIDSVWVHHMNLSRDKADLSCALQENVDGFSFGRRRGLDEYRRS